MTDTDRQIGRNVARLRGDRSQKDLADEMRERGHKWSQATVWSVEKGDRPLRLSEAQDLVAVFKLGLRGTEALTAPDANTRFLLKTQEVVRMVGQLREAGREFLNSQSDLAILADMTELSGLEVRQAQSWLEMTAADAAMDGIRADGRIESSVPQSEIDKANAGYPFLQLLNKTYAEHSEEA